MDPFNQVYSDAESQLRTTEALLLKFQKTPSDNNTLADLNNSVQELVETIHDLSQSIGVVQSEPERYGLTEHDINSRIQQVGKLNRELNEVQTSIMQAKKAAAANTVAKQAELDSHNENSIGNNPHDSLANNPALMMELQDQDNVLDSVYNTVSSLREQAHVMSRELEDQSNLIDEFDRDVDTAQERLRRGLKRVDWVVKNNRETLSSCCITLLIIVLIILLVLVIIA